MGDISELGRIMRLVDAVVQTHSRAYSDRTHYSERQEADDALHAARSELVAALSGALSISESLSVLGDGKVYRMVNDRWLPVD